ncbi:pPIWI_RE module domain-containing protein [Streptomyces niveus]
MYQTIRVTAYEPDPAHGPWQEELQVMRLGEQLHTELTRRWEQTRPGADHPLRLPVRRLNSLLLGMAPGVLATGRNAGSDGRLPWLYAHESVPHEVLAPLALTWAGGVFRRDDEEDGAEDWDLEDELLAEGTATALGLPAWEAETVDLTETIMSAGGTAEPLHRLYSLLPEQVALRLAARPFGTLGTTLRFRVVSTDGGAELISWPPQRYERRNETWYYSAQVKIAVHTVPFAPRFRLHVSTGVRRWATRLELRPHQMSGATVLLDAPLPWPGGSGRHPRLMRNTLGYDRRRREIAWRRHSPALLVPELDIVRRYPDPAELFTSPDKWITGRGDIAAGIVYHPKLGSHEVGPGLMPRERAELDGWVEEGLRPVLRRVADLGRVTRRNTPSLLPRSVKKDEPLAREAQLALRRQAALRRALAGRPLEVEILWQSVETRTALLAELPKLVGLPPGTGREIGDDTWQWRADAIEINVRTRPAGVLLSPLPTSGNRARRRAVRLADAINDRCALADEHMEPPRSGAALVVAEIADKSQFAAQPDSDPKHALRLAWARQGRISQFVNLPTASTSLEHRARWTWLDAFRQLGAISPPAHRVGAGIPGDLQYAALWVVRYTAHGPTRCPARRLVAVRVRPREAQGALEGWDAERSVWVPYPQLLLSLADGNIRDRWRRHDVDGEGVDERWQRETQRQIRALLFQLRERPTLLLASSANLRQCWPRLSNGSLSRDMLGFGTEPDQRLTLYGSDLRVVLVRDANSREEVPEWYAHDGDGRIGFAEGVWGSAAPENRVFASTCSTPHTAVLPKGLRKLVPTSESRTAPGKTAWNPAQLEVTVLGCLSEKALTESDRAGTTPDRPAEWATLAHQLRYHDDYPPLARPLPLHLARLAAEYVLPLAEAPSAPAAGDGS